MTSALTLGIPVSIPLIAYGGTPPYTYSIVSGLPAGLSLNASTGLISGTPTTLQVSTALVWQVEDAALDTAMDSFQVVVQAVPVAVPFYSFVAAVSGRFRLRGAFAVSLFQSANLAGGAVVGGVLTTRPLQFASIVGGAVAGGVATAREFIGANLVGGAVGGGVLANRAVDRANLVSGAVVGGVLTATPAFEPETDTLLAALTGTYDTARQSAINTLIKALKDAGVWSTRDVICIAGLNSTDSLINWKNPGTFNSSLVNSPTFTVDRGFTGNGTTSYINTNFNPSTAGGNYAQNSASYGFYSRTNSAVVGTDMGVDGTAGQSMYLESRFSDGNYYYSMNNGGFDFGSSSNSSGAWVVTRTSSTAKRLSRNSTTIDATSRTSTSLPNQTFFVAGRNGNGTLQNPSPRQYAYWFIGGGMDTTQTSNFNSAMLTYLTYIGANV